MSIVIDVISKLANDNSGSLKFLHQKVRNWHEVVLLLTGARRNIDVILRNGKKYRISVKEGYVESGWQGVKLAYHTKDERIHAILAMIGEFLDEGHIDLKVKGRNVVDIGAYIGDTPLYFALRGAKHVYGLEPYPYSYERAKMNVSLNKLDDMITMINAGCGSRKGDIRIKTDFDKGLAGSRMRSSSRGKRVPVLTLEQLIDRYKLGNAVLKVDCEGCEYDILINASDKTLRKFGSMLIEYHYGPSRLEKRLRKAGFKIRHIEAEHAVRNVNVENKQMHAGTILAELR